MAKLLVPRDHLMGHPATPGAYLALAKSQARRVGRTVTEDAREVVAYVTAGMWVVDCLHCGNGVAIHPEWDVAACLGTGCYRIYRHITVPVQWKHIEAVLSVRPLMNQNWLASPARTRIKRSRVALADEPIEELIAENLLHGLPSGLENL